MGGWDGNLGGFEFDMIIADMLADKFNEIWAKKKKDSGDIRDITRPMARLRTEAKKIKEVLSANTEFPFKVEQLHAELDISTKVTRADFEAASKDLTDRLTVPIDKALKMANLTLSDINSVELLGGSVRMPQVKKKLEEYFGAANIEMGQHLNGDEAMALGAAFRAANLSTAFRVRKVGSSDISSFGVRVKLESLNKEGEKGRGVFGLFNGKKDDSKDYWEKQTSVFPAKSLVPSKTKTLAFNHDNDILCRIEYENEDNLTDIPPLLGIFNITGLSEFAQDTVAKGLGIPKVHLSFSLDSSGVVTLSKAEATVELPPDPELETEEESETPSTEGTEGTEGTETNSTGESTSESKLQDEESTKTRSNSTVEKEGKGHESAFANNDTETQDMESTDIDSATNSSSNSTKPFKGDRENEDKKTSKKKENKQKKDNMLRKTLVVVDNPELISPVLWTPSKIAEARGRLGALAAADELRRKKEAANNELEGFIYSIRGKFIDEEEALSTVTTEEQRKAVVDMANELEEWLYDEGRNADLADYKAKHIGLQELSSPIIERLVEKELRPKAIDDARATMVKLEGKIDAWNETMPHITDEEKEKIKSLIKDVREWIYSKLEEQEKLQPHVEPAFKSSQVELQLKPVFAMYQRLYKKPKPKPDPKAKNESASRNETDGQTNSTESETVKVKVDTESEGGTTEANVNVDDVVSEGDTDVEIEESSGSHTVSEEEL